MESIFSVSTSQRNIWCYLTKDTETKRAELLQFIKTVGAPHIYTTYNFYLKETGCKELIPDGPGEPILDA
jgi:hypothetical protein